MSKRLVCGKVVQLQVSEKHKPVTAPAPIKDDAPALKQEQEAASPPQTHGKYHLNIGLLF